MRLFPLAPAKPYRCYAAHRRVVCDDIILFTGCFFFFCFCFFFFFRVIDFLWLFGLVATLHWLYFDVTTVVVTLESELSAVAIKSDGPATTPTTAERAVAEAV